jgi:hypothetical protein
LTDIRYQNQLSGNLKLAVLSYAAAGALFGNGSASNYLEVATAAKNQVALVKSTQTGVSGAKAWGYTTFTFPDYTMAFLNYNAAEDAVEDSINYGFEVAGTVFAGVPTTAPLNFSAQTPLGLPSTVVVPNPMSASGPIVTPVCPPKEPHPFKHPLKVLEDVPLEEKEVDASESEHGAPLSSDPPPSLPPVVVKTFARFRAATSKPKSRRA